MLFTPTIIILQYLPFYALLEHSLHIHHEHDILLDVSRAALSARYFNHVPEYSRAVGQLKFECPDGFVLPYAAYTLERPVN